MLVYLRDGSAQTTVRSATLRQKLQIKLAVSTSHSVLTPGRPVPITPDSWQGSQLFSQWYDMTWRKDPRPKLESNPALPLSRSDVFTGRPRRRSVETGRLVGLVVKASASRAEDPGFESPFRRDFSGSSHTSDFKIGTPVATLPGAWSYRVNAGTGRPGVSIL